jgi:predicted amidohydrolase YtcJ
MSSAQPKQAADVIYVNGSILVWAGPDTVGTTTVDPFVQAIAIVDGRVMGIGSNDKVTRLKGKQTKVVDLHGAFVMPGFNDAHTHIGEAGASKLNVALAGTKSLEEMKQRIAAAAKVRKPGEWLQGFGWDHTKWTKVVLPTRQDLDAVTGDHPAIFTRTDGHIAVANTLALKVAGVTGATKPEAGGAIDLDSNGEPTGILREGARDLVYSKIPPPTPEQRRRALELALADAAEHGVTSVQDYSDWENFLVLEQMEKEGKLTLRVSEWLTFKDDLKTLDEERAHHPQDDAMLHTAMLKGFMDGSLGSRTAALLAPYADDPKNTGLPQWQQDQLNAKAIETAKDGFQLGFHAIGNRAAQMALDAFAAAEKAGAATPERRFRIEHLQVTTPEQFQQLHDLGVIASIQPCHLLSDMYWAESRIGPERAKTSYAWRTLLENKIPIAFGTDYPVEPITPFRNLYVAVTRKSEDGKRDYFPEQKLTIDEAIAAYTTGSAYAQFAEKEKGTLAPGMLADFVVLDRDITKAKPEAILKTKVLRTVVGGKTVYEAK